MPGSQNGSLRTGREISHFEIVESDKEESSSVGTSDEACKHENSKKIWNHWINKRFYCMFRCRESEY